MLICKICSMTYIGPIGVMLHKKINREGAVRDPALLASILLEQGSLCCGPWTTSFCIFYGLKMVFAFVNWLTKIKIRIFCGMENYMKLKSYFP